MKKLITIIGISLSLLFLYTYSAYGQDKIKVVASTLDIADLAKNIGGEYVEVYAISKGKIDLHFFEPRPSHVMKLKNADLLIIGGLDLDIWIQALIDASRNPKIRFGSIGYVDPSDGITPLDVPPGRIDGSMGDVHPYGNPHYWFTPENIKVAIENIYNGLQRLDPNHKDYYLERKKKYMSKVLSSFERLKNRMGSYKGTKVVQFHKSWDYFCKTFGLEIIGQLEPKPGIPPSPAHLKELVGLIKSENAKIMLAEPYYSKGPIEFVKRNTGITVLRLPIYLGSKKGINSYLENLEYNVNTIIEALTN